MYVYIVIHNITGRQIGGVYHSPAVAELASQQHNARWVRRWVGEED